MAEQDLSRRAFLQKTALLGVAVGAGTLLASCADSAEAPPEGEGAEQAAGAPLDCSDTSGLTEVEVQTREGLQYVETTEKADQDCTNCLQYQLPEAVGGCGKCTLVPGTINPKGWCLSWAAKA